MIETLGKLFGSQARVKVMRLFMQNPETPFDAKEIAKRCRIRIGEARKELNLLLGANFLKKKIFSKIIEGKRKSRRVQFVGGLLNQEFEYLDALRVLVVEASLIQPKYLIRKLRPSGKLKLVIMAGVFTHNPESRLDLLVVGDNLRRNVIETAVRAIEAETGKELAYAVFETSEFQYRIDMYDKLVCDVLEFPHEKLIDLIGVSEKIRI